MPDKFKVAFPDVRLPENRGGRRAIVVFAVRHKNDFTMCLATCIDDQGTPHVQVPFLLSEIRQAPHMVLMEAPGERAPTVGGGGHQASAHGLVKPDGTPL